MTKKELLRLMFILTQVLPNFEEEKFIYRNPLKILAVLSYLL